MHLYNAYVTNVIDGDTIDANVDLGFHVFTKIRFRLYGIDTMETNDKDPEKRELAKRAKDYVLDRILNRNIRIRSRKTDKYGRWLGEIYMNDVNLNEELINEGLAVSYFGGTR